MNATLEDKIAEIEQTLTELYMELADCEEIQVEERGELIKQIKIYEQIKDGLYSNLQRPKQQSVLYFDN